MCNQSCKWPWGVNEKQQEAHRSSRLKYIFNFIGGIRAKMFRSVILFVLRQCLRGTKWAQDCPALGSGLSTSAIRRKESRPKKDKALSPQHPADGTEPGEEFRSPSYPTSILLLGSGFLNAVCALHILAHCVLLFQLGYKQLFWKPCPPPHSFS